MRAYVRHITNGKSIRDTQSNKIDYSEILTRKTFACYPKTVQNMKRGSVNYNTFWFSSKCVFWSSAKVSLNTSFFKDKFSVAQRQVLLNAAPCSIQVLSKPETSSPDRHFVQGVCSVARQRFLLSAALCTRQFVCSPETSSPKRGISFKTSSL
jgi:hypothetical protein